MLVGLFVAALGLAVIAGWQWNLPVLKSVFPGMLSMKVNAAICFVLCGMGLALLVKGKGRGAGYGLVAIAMAATAIAAVTLGEYFFNWNPGIDQWLIHDDAELAGIWLGCMAPSLAMSFVLISAALLTARWARAGG